MHVTIRDGRGQIRHDLDPKALIKAVRSVDPSVVAGSLNELVLSRSDPEFSQLIFHRAPDRRYMVTHVDSTGRGRTAIADGHPSELVTLTIEGEPEVWAGDYFVDSVTAGALAETFIVNGGRDPCVEWRPSTGHL
jgi:hypothetical protein